MKEIKNTTEFLAALSAIPMVANRNARATEQLAEILPRGLFDSIGEDRVGNILLRRSCGRTGAPILCIDAHFDRIGMLLRSFEGEGFVGVTPVGGLDLRTLPAQPVIICGRERVRGLIVSTPPHLRRPDEGDMLTPADRILIDTGYSEEKLRRLVSVGDPIIFDAKFGHLASDRIFSAGLDNTACVAAAIMAADSLRREDMAFDLVLLLAAGEESGGYCGSQYGLNETAPDFAVVLDVEFADCRDATIPGLPKMGDGPVIAYSSLTDPHLTSHVIQKAREAHIGHTVMGWGGNLGTDGNTAALCADGISAVSLSLPLARMHTCTEALSVSDLDSLSQLLSIIISDHSLDGHTIPKITRERRASI